MRTSAHPGGLAGIGVLFMLLAQAAAADDTQRFTVLFGGKKAGEQVVTVRSNGRIEIEYSYRDNGRGPTLSERIRIEPDGTLGQYAVKGTSTFGAPVQETFTRRGDRVEWRSASDRGSARVPSPALYVPVERSRETLAILARALARAPGQRMRALPEGELALEKLSDATLSSGARTTQVSLYAITGLSVDPDFVWLTTEGARSFAFVQPGWFQIVAEGWEDQAETLESLQQQAETAWLERLAGKLTHRMVEPILLRNVRVFDSRAGTLGAPADVYVWRGRIGAIYPANSTPREAGTVIEGSGRALLPGLFDMHTHEGSWNMMLQIAGGVTTSRDMGNDNAIIAELIAHVEAGRLAGPRIVPAGYIEGESPFSSRGGFVVSDLEQAKQAVDWYAQRGYRQIKIYNSFRPEWVAPTAAYAHERGMRVSGHIPAFMLAEQAVRAGYDEIQHINQLTLNFLAGPKDDTRTLARFYLVTERARDLDLASPEVRAFIELLKARGTVLDATLATFEAMFTQKQGEMSPTFAAVADHVPVGLQREWRTNSMDVTEANVRRYRESWARLLELIGLLHREGVPLVAGTDEIAGFTLHRELELYTLAGISPGDALRIATFNGAKYSGLGDSLGVIEAGRIADLILVEGDPTTNISDIRRISLVMRGDRIYFPSEVYAALGVRPFAAPPSIPGRGRQEQEVVSAPAL